MSTYPSTASLPQNGSVVARYLLDEASGNAIAETGGLNMTDVNSVGAGTGLVRTGASYDNSRDLNRAAKSHFSHADHATFSFTSDFSFVGWINLETQLDTGEDYVIFSKWDFDTDNKDYLFRADDSGGTKRLLWVLTDNGLVPPTSGSVNQTFTTGTWYQVGMAYDASAGETIITVDGSLLGTVTSLDTSIHDGNQTFRIGDNTASNDQSSSNSNADALYQDFIFWNAELSATDFSDIKDLWGDEVATGVAPRSTLSLMGV